MATVIRYTCLKCLRTRNIGVGSGQRAPTLCPNCQNEENNRKRQLYFEHLDTLTIEERVRKIEEWIYNYKPTYVSPPTF